MTMDILSINMQGFTRQNGGESDLDVMHQLMDYTSANMLQPKQRGNPMAYFRIF